MKNCKIKVPPDRVVRDAVKLRRGIVSTILAPLLRDIARFAAYHLDLGASEINIYLAQPDTDTAAFFSPTKPLKLFNAMKAQHGTRIVSQKNE